MSILIVMSIYLRIKKIIVEQPSMGAIPKLVLVYVKHIIMMTYRSHQSLRLGTYKELPLDEVSTFINNKYDIALNRKS